MILPIVTYGHPALKTQSARVGAIDGEIRRLVENMFETLEAAKGVGLAANQVGVTRQVIVVDTGQKGERFALVNPKIVARSGRQVGEEGCLSLPGLWGLVPRAEELKVSALDLEGKPTELEGEGLLARVLAHEIDHLRGKLFPERAQEGSLYWLRKREDTNSTNEEASEPNLERVPVAWEEARAYFLSWENNLWLPQKADAA